MVKIVDMTSALQQVREKAPDTADAMKRFKSGNAGFTDKAHLKAKGMIPRADGTKKVSPKYEGLNEKKADFLRLNFANNQTVKKAERWLYNNLGHSNPGYTSIIADKNSIEFQDMNDADSVMTKLKRAGFSFKVDMREDLDKKDVATIKPIIKQLQKSVKSHDKQAKQLAKDISDEKDLEEEIGRISGFKTDKVKKEYVTMAKSKGLKTSIDSKGSLVIDGPQKTVRDVLTKANIDGINRLTVNIGMGFESLEEQAKDCLLYTSPSPRDRQKSRMPSSA